MNRIKAACRAGDGESGTEPGENALPQLPGARRGSWGNRLARQCAAKGWYVHPLVEDTKLPPVSAENRRGGEPGLHHAPGRGVPVHHPERALARGTRKQPATWP